MPHEDEEVKAETRVLLLQAKECQELTASHEKLGEKRESDPPP